METTDIKARTATHNGQVKVSFWIDDQKYTFRCTPQELDKLLHREHEASVEVAFNLL